jgi:hypothetical protein
MIDRDGQELSRAMTGSASASQARQLEERGGETGPTNKDTHVSVQRTVEQPRLGDTEKDWGHEKAGDRSWGRDTNKVCSASRKVTEKGPCSAQSGTNATRCFRKESSWMTQQAEGGGAATWELGECPLRFRSIVSKKHHQIGRGHRS